ESDSYAPAKFLDASSDGTRSFFITNQALTNDAPVTAVSLPKLYEYDASKAASDPHNLTYIAGAQDSQAPSVTGLAAISEDGSYVYFVTDSGLYLWHEHQVRFVAPASGPGFRGEFLSTNFYWALQPNQTRLSPDGRFLLFPGRSAALTGNQPGTCQY